MSITKWKNQSGNVYAYETTARYDPVTRQSRPIKKYLGRVDPETGEIIKTTGKRGRPPKEKPAEPEAGSPEELFQSLKETKQELTLAQNRITRLESEILQLRGELAESMKREKKTAAFMRQLAQLVEQGQKLTTPEATNET